MIRPALAASLPLLLSLLAGCADEAPGPAPAPSSSSTPPAPAATPSGSGTATPSPSPSPSPAPRPARTVQKDVADNSFPDGTFTIQKGDTVTWTHRGTNLHSITSSPGAAEAFDSHPDCPPVCMVGGTAYTHTFDTMGEVPYECKLHGSMKGTLTVVEALPA